MLKFMDGFDQLKGVADPVKGLAQCGYTATGGVTLAPGRTATQIAVQLADTASLVRVFPSPQSQVVFGFAFKAVGGRMPLLSIKSVGTLTWDGVNGKLSMAGGQGTAILLLELWYYIEVVLDKAAATLTVYVNNGKDFEAALPTGANPLTEYELTWASASKMQLLIDDLVFIDAENGKYINRVGPVAITSRLPMVDVDKEWSPSTGTDHYPLVYNQPPVDGKYIQSNTSGAVDTFLSNTPLPQTTGIVAVGMTVLCKKSDVDNRQLGMCIGQKSAAQKVVIDTELSTEPQYSYAVFETNQTGLDWNDERLSQAPFGVIVKP